MPLILSHTNNSPNGAVGNNVNPLGGNQISVNSNIQCGSVSGNIGGDSEAKEILSNCIIQKVSSDIYGGYSYIEILDNNTKFPANYYFLRVRDLRKNLVWEGTLKFITAATRLKDYLQICVVNTISKAESPCFLKVTLPTKITNYQKSDFILSLKNNILTYSQASKGPQKITLSRGKTSFIVEKGVPIAIDIHNIAVLDKNSFNNFKSLPGISYYLVELGDYIQL